MKKSMRTLINLFTLALLLVGIATCHTNNVKIFQTASSLIVLNDNIQFYNEQSRKTDSMTADAEKDFEARRDIYNSEDFVIRAFSNQNAVIKIAIIFLAILSYPIMFVVVAFQILKTYYTLKKKTSKRKAV